MKLLATLPSPHERSFFTVLACPEVAEFRFNVGVRTPWSPRETLERILDRCSHKPLWVDLKGRQLRIAQWAVPTYGDIVLNHEVEVTQPATILFRGGDESAIREVRGRRVFVDPPPRNAVGAGQAINIHAATLVIHGYLTEEDEAYLDAAKDLGLTRFMLSFVEQQSDLDCVLQRIPGARLALKIESPKGLDWVRREFDSRGGTARLVAARDDLWLNIGQNKLQMLPALRLLVERDPTAIVASRLLGSLERQPAPDMGDLADLFLMHQLGFREFMLSDGVSRSAIEPSAAVWREFVRAIESPA